MSGRNVVKSVILLLFLNGRTIPSITEQSHLGLCTNYTICGFIGLKLVLKIGSP